MFGIARTALFLSSPGLSFLLHIIVAAPLSVLITFLCNECVGHSVFKWLWAESVCIPVCVCLFTFTFPASVYVTVYAQQFLSVIVCRDDDTLFFYSSKSICTVAFFGMKDAFLMGLWLLTQQQMNPLISVSVSFPFSQTVGGLYGTITRKM